MSPGDLAAAWVFAALLVIVLAILGAVLQAFFLHSALARAKVHAPELAGIRLLALWLPAVLGWLAAAALASAALPARRCAPADAWMLWLALLYPVTVWPAAVLARKRGVRLGAGYWWAQGFAPVSLLALGGLSCL